MAKTKTIDSIVRDILHDNGWTMHFYVRMLHHALRGLEELSYDYPLYVKTVTLDVTTAGAIIMPSDFIDVISLEAPDGDRLRPFVSDASLNPMYNYDSKGDKIKYPFPEKYSPERYSEDVPEAYTSHTNANGENIGRFFGFVGGKDYAYVLVPERGEIQLSTTLANATMVLTYLPDGIETTAQNVIHPYAVETLKLYCHWKMVSYFKPFGNARYSDIRMARAEFFNAKRVLRARFNDMGIEEIIASLRVVHMGLKN